MSIGQRKNINILKPRYVIQENTLSDSQILTEELGAFNTQYVMADIMANTAIEMIKYHVKEKECVFPNVNCRWKEYKIEIVYPEDSPLLFFNTTATFNGCNDTKVVVLLKIAKNDILALSAFEFRAKLTKIIAHELNHGYTIISTYKSKGDIPNYPRYYHQMMSIIQDNSIDPESLVYKLAYAFYASSYIELPAFVSQTVPQIANSLKNKNCSYEVFKKEIKKTESYKLYSDILGNILPNIEACDKESLIIELNSYDVKINVQKLNKLLLHIKNNSEKALKNIVRNSMIYFHEHIQSKKTDWFQKN